MPDGESINPRNNFFLLGQEEAEKVLLEAFNGNTLHNSWLISGEKGIGKATLAYKFARFLLDENRSTTTLSTSPDSRSNRLLSSGSHPDFKALERDFIETDRRKVIKAIKEGEAMDEEELKNLKKSAYIRIDDIRAIHDFLSKKSSDGGWRVVVIDSIDDVNAAAGNALLKILEEPPSKTVILLVSHNPAQLLPTIRSRCNKLILKPLEDNAVMSLLRRYRPELDETAVKGLAKIASGSIGKALNYADLGALDKYRRLGGIIYSGTKFKLDDLLDWAGEHTKTEEGYDLACELILKFCSDNITSCNNLEGVAGIWENALRAFRHAETVNMDKKQLLINVVGSLCKAV